MNCATQFLPNERRKEKKWGEKEGSFGRIYSGHGLVHCHLNRRAISHDILMLAFAISSFPSSNYLTIHIYDSTPFWIVNKLARCQVKSSHLQSHTKRTPWILLLQELLQVLLPWPQELPWCSLQPMVHCLSKLQ